MTLKDIGDGIRKSFRLKSDLWIDGVGVIIHKEGKTYLEKEFLIKYGNIIRMILRDMLEVKEIKCLK